MRFEFFLAVGLTLSTLFVACASEEDKDDVFTPSAGGADAGKGGSAGSSGTKSSGGSAGQAGQTSQGGAAGSSGGAAGSSGGAAGSSGGAAGEGGQAGANGGAAGDGGTAGDAGAAGASGGAAGASGGAAGSTGGAAGSSGSGGSAGAADCWSVGYAGNCDPVHNDCTGGMACDLMEDWEGYLVRECVTDGPQKAGESCNDLDGPYCAAELHCNPVKEICQKFCCTDADCSGVGGTCKPIDANTDALGLCE